MSKKKPGLGKFIAGVAIGGALGVLFAPKAGSETRKDLKKKLDELINKAKEIDVDEVRDDIEKKIENIKEALNELDKEKVLAIAKKQAAKIKESADELVEYVKEKGTPLLEKTAEAARKKAVAVTKEVLEKLEKKENAK